MNMLLLLGNDEISRVDSKAHDGKMNLRGSSGNMCVVAARKTERGMDGKTRMGREFERRPGQEEVRM